MSEHITLEMPEACDLRTVRSIRDDLVAALQRGLSVALDCAAVARTDIAFVQLVVAAGRSAARRGVTVTLAGVTPSLETAFRRAGFDPLAPLTPAS
jgi:phospholipid transport system transporter-binding protein